MCTADIKNLPNGSGALTVFTNDNGGILDDLIVTKVTDEFLYVVSNAGRKQEDMDLMENTVVRFVFESFNFYFNIWTQYSKVLLLSWKIN